jgi:hypothetical protein
MRSRVRSCLLGVAAVVAGALAACTPVERPHRSQDAEALRVEAPAVEPDAPVVTILQTRDHEVTVYASVRELKFTVAASGGTVLANKLSEDEFRASFPGLYTRYDRAFAGEDGWVDASRPTRADPRGATLPVPARD